MGRHYREPVDEQRIEDLERAEKQSLSVGELCHIVDQTFSTLFTDELWIRGAISGLKRSANGHVYFDLVDPDEIGGSPTAVLPVALFANAKFRVNAILKKTGSIRMEDGIEIRIRGKVTFYPRQSRVQLIMSLIDPSFTLGQMEAARAQLIARLRSEGLLDANRQRPMPVLPLTVGLITSRGSAAEADFLHELDESGLPFVVHPFDARVQGLEAVASIVHAIEKAQTAPVDAIVLIRGGGARTDLAAFDHEDVARAIARCQLPVIVGVGHEIDHSVADDVAHTATKTPTAAAGVLIDTVLSFQERISSARVRIGRAATAAVDRQGFRLELLEDRIGRSVMTRLERAESQLERAHVRARSLDPALTLARGWSITRDTSGKVVRSPAELNDGDVVHTTLAEGTVSSTVQAP